jgi:hypothetical protein
LQNLRLNFENPKGRSDAQSSSSAQDEDGDRPHGLSDNILSAQSSLQPKSQTLSASVLPSPSLHRNVTKRRSNGRARDSLGGSTSVPVSKLLERVPLGRAQDEAYARETRMGRQDSHLNSPGSGINEVSSSVKKPSKPSFSIPDFTRKAIPTEFENPKLHKKLRNMWIRKKGIEEDMADALENDKEDKYKAYAEQHAAINRDMFAALETDRMSGEDDGIVRRPMLPDQTISYDFEPHGVRVEKLAPRHPDKNKVLQPWEYDGTSIRIWFSYQMEEHPYVVWPHMPVALLVDAAIELLQQLGEDADKEQVVLMHYSRFMDATFERLSDHDVESEDIIEIVLNRQQVRKPITHSKPDSKYYAVRRGRSTGIFRSWGECQNQVDGYPNCEFKSFQSEKEAYEYLSEGSRQETVPAVQNMRVVSPANGQMSSKSQDKIKQTFKCPRFSGNSKDWKIWNKGFQRYLSIWDLGYVLYPEFYDDLPLSPAKVNDSKLVYYILEDATQASPLASSYLRQAPLENGFEAYYTLHDGFVFAASTASTILLNELSNFRFLPDETPTGLILRLEELFQDMAMLPSGAAMTFNDTQCIGYLLGALRHEPEWATVASAITSSQLKGDTTFRQACDELRFRCEAGRAYEIIDKDVKQKRKVPALAAHVEPILEDSAIESITTALVSSVAKRLNKEVTPDAKSKADKKKNDKKKFPCLAKGCGELTAFSLCGLHYHSIISGKISELELMNEFGQATYNVTTRRIDYPAKVPVERLPPVRKQ